MAAPARPLALAIDPPAILLRRQVERIAELRDLLFADSSVLKMKQDAFLLNNAELLRRVETMRQDLADAEKALRTAAEEHYQATDEKHPAPGVSIRLVTAIAYDATTALAWAKGKGIALALDTKAFEALAKHDKSVPATVTQVPKATLATDLHAALTEAV